MKEIRIDYLNKKKEVRHIFTDISNYWDILWHSLACIIKQWATDIRVYNVDFEPIIKDTPTNK